MSTIPFQTSAKGSNGSSTQLFHSTFPSFKSPLTDKTMHNKADNESFSSIKTTSSEDDIIARARRSATPSPEPRPILNPGGRPRESFPTLPKDPFPGAKAKELFSEVKIKELFPTKTEGPPPVKKLFPQTREPFPTTEELIPTTKELFPWTEEMVSETKEISPALKELFPWRTRELFPHERVPNAFVPTPKKELFPKQSTPMADSRSADAGQWKELFASGWPKQQPREHREKDPRLSPGNSRWPNQRPREDSRSPSPNNRNITSLKAGDESHLQNAALVSSGKWQHDLFNDINPQNSCSPSRRSLSSPRTSKEKLSTSPANPTLVQKSGNVLGTLHGPSKDMTTTKFSSTPIATTNPNENSIPIQNVNIPRQQLQQTSRDGFSTPKLVRYSSPDLSCHTGQSNFPTPTPKRHFTPESTTSQNSVLEIATVPRRRPETTDLVARRMIGSALGVWIPKRVDDRSVEIAQEMRGKCPSEGNETRGAWRDVKEGIPEPNKEVGMQ